MMKNILVPTDLTSCTENTLKYAISIALKSGSKLFFYHVDVKPCQEPIHQKNLIKMTFKELDVDFDKVQSEFIFETGNFSNERIEKIIESHKIDFVIMGASHEGFRKTFFGTHVSDLINEVDIPVLSFPHGYNKLSIERIGFASEMFDVTKRLYSIVPFAKMLDAHIDIFHVYPVYPQAIDINKCNTQKFLDRIKKLNNYDNISIKFIKTAMDNEPVTGMMKYIESEKPDLLVMFHKPRGLFDKLAFDIGATPSMLKKSPVPVLAFSKKYALKIS
jgi:nucleotide-binding universal stress UspA family protein